MKILVATSSLDGFRSSAGICNANLLRAFGIAGHEVTVFSPLCRPVLPEGASCLEYPAIPSSPALRLVRYLEQSLRAASAGGPRRALFDKLEALLNYATGRNFQFAGLELAWRQALGWLLERGSTDHDLLFFCSGGGDFTAALAMTRLARRRGAVPFVTYYPDPSPMSLYPPPYSARALRISGLQERGHRRILAASTALSFPSERLRDWVTEGDPALVAKSAVLPHPAIGPGVPLPELDQIDAALEPLALQRMGADRFSVLHAGTLLSKRDPSALLEAWEGFAAASPERRDLATLVHVGPVHPERRDARWRRSQEDPTVALIDRRIGYVDALALARAATVSVVLEAASVSSPFFPGKLADLIWLDKPVVGLSPGESVVVDLLGADHPLCAEPGDVEGIRAVLETAWQAWREGTLTELRPPAGAHRATSPERHGEALDLLRRRVGTEVAG